MFTGIIREVGSVAATSGGDEGVRLRIEAPATAPLVEVGGSVAINGVCLTAETVEGAALTFHAVPETLSRSTLGELARGSRVNLEPALRAGDSMGGHIVQGHVDGVGRVQSVEAEGEGLRVIVEAPADVLRYCVEKGSITIEGVSLTIAEVHDDAFGVALIPHTIAETTLARLVPGQRVNLEADVLAKYVERLAEPRLHRP
jgi:riboflavin synthase